MRIAIMLVLLIGGLGSAWIAAYMRGRGATVPVVGLAASSAMLLTLFGLVLWTLGEAAFAPRKVTTTVRPNSPGNPYEPPTQHPSEAGEEAKD